MAYYISSITKKLKFINSHCSIVCSYCSGVCLIAKNELENEIHVVDGPFNEGSKNVIFFQGSPNFERGTTRKFRENGQWQGHLLLCKSGGGQFRKRISVPTPWFQNPCDASNFLHARPHYRKKNEKNSIFRPKFDLPKI